MRLFDHPLWPTLLPNMYLDQGGKINGPRQRIECYRTAPRELLDMIVDCPHCHKPYPYVRVTKHGKWTCNQSAYGDVACRNSKECREQANAVRRAMEEYRKAQLVLAII